MKVSPKDKQKVLEWMMKYANGYKNARNKEEILPHIETLIPGISERYLRACLSDLKHEGEIGALSSCGYWWIKAVNLPYDDKEKKMALRSVREMKSRALDMLEDCSRLERKFCESGIQATMFDDIGQMADGIDKMGAR